MRLIKYLRLWIKTLGLELSSEMAYKTNFIIKLFSLVVMDVISPLVALLIYTSTPGIPGWTLNQFLLFQGITILVFGIGHFSLWEIPYTVMSLVRSGNFDKVLIKPYNSLGYIFATSIDIEGFSEIVVGIILIIYASIQLNIGLSWNILFSLFYFVLALIFMFSLVTLISSLTFLVVKSFALFDVMFNILDLARYPATIYSGGIRFFITFLFPIAIASTYPAESILHGFSSVSVYIVISVLAFFSLSLIMWNLAMKKYSSAGG